MLLPMQSLALSATTFVGQNLGRGNEPRARQGVRRALAIAMAATVLVMIPVLVFAPQMTAFFNRKPEVVAYGALLLRCISPFYVLCCFNQVYAAALRGAGNSKATMIIMLCSFVLFRQVYLFIMSHYISHELDPAGHGLSRRMAGMQRRHADLLSPYLLPVHPAGGGGRQQGGHPMTKCESCVFYQYDENYDDYVCDMDLDEDEMVRFLSSQTDSCPYWRPGDDYLTARRQ